MKTNSLTLLIALVLCVNDSIGSSYFINGASDSNKVSIQFSGGVSITNYSLKDSYDYYGDSVTDIDTLTNHMGKAFELSVDFPIKKSKFSIDGGVGYSERNLKRIMDKEYMLIYSDVVPTESEVYSYRYLSFSLGCGYRLIERKHYFLGLGAGFSVAYIMDEKTITNLYQTDKPFITRKDWVLPTKKKFVPVYFKVNNYYKINKNLALGISIGMFYDTALPFPDNITQNRINYSSDFLFRVEF